MGAREQVEALELLIRAERLSLTDPERALELLDSSVFPQVRRDDPALNARAAYLRAQLRAQRGEYGAALASIRTARRDWLAAGSVLDALRTDLGRGTVLHELGEYRQAVRVSSDLLEELARIVPSPEEATAVSSIQARAHSNMANAWSRLGEHSTALEHYDVAVNLFHALGERDKQAETDANRGLTYLRLGMAHRALDDLSRAEAALRDQGSRLAAAKCRVDIAGALLQLDRLSESLSVLVRVRPILEELAAAPEMARLGLTLARALLRAGLVGDAHAEAVRAAEVFADLGMLDESARATYTSALASMVIGTFDDAAAEFAAAGRLFADCGDLGYCARVWLAQAHLAQRAGDVDEAGALVDRALEQLEARREMVPTAFAHLLAAELDDASDKAAAHLEQAAGIITTLDLPELGLALVQGRANLLRRHGDFEGACELLRTAMRSRPLPAVSTGDAELRIALHAATGGAVDALIDALLRQGTPAAGVEAWQWSVFAATRALQDFVSGRAPDGEPPGAPLEPPDRVTRPTDLSRFLGPGLPEEDGQLVLTNEPHPAFVQSQSVRAGTPDPLDLAVPEGPILHFHVLGPDLVVFVVRDGEVYARRAPGVSERSRELTRDWQVACSRLASGQAEATSSVSDVEPLLRELYRLLLAPVDDLLADLYAQPLLVVAEGHLANVPFAALHDGGESFSARHPLTFAPGLAAPPSSDAAESVTGAGVLVLAVPDAAAPGIAAEARALAGLHPGADVLVGDAATSEALFRGAPGRALVHLACHGEFRAGAPLSSALRLADRWVTAEEVLRMHLEGTLVVLSACASGRASDSLAEPAGLAWAFLAAGCRGVISSNWAVDDSTAVEMMRALHEHLAGGASPRDSLARARDEVARRHPHPYHWASFRYLCSTYTAVSEGLAP
jgi:tetratricopeptide (TPR) repeat protein